jgi:molecular chaperone GrpE
MIVRRIELAKEKKEEVKEEEVSEATSTEGSADVESTNNDDSTTETQATTALDDIKKVEAERDELSDKYIRAQAEIVNMRRRNEKEQASLIKYDGQKLAKAILPALDNLERALAVESASEQL